MKKIIVLLGFCLLSISCLSTGVVKEHSLESINALLFTAIKTASNSWL